jgi:hypothetical protein
MHPYIKLDLNKKIFIYIFKLKINNNLNIRLIMRGLGIGDWGLGIGDWGLGPIPNPQSPLNYEN